MTDKAISPLRQRLIDDLAIRRLGPKTRHEYIRRVKGFADFLGRSPAKATAEDVDRYQLRLASIGATVSTVNATASALRFFFKVTLKRSDLADGSCRSASLAASPLFSAPKRSVGFSRRRRTSSRRRP
jgi:integrase/recombinase XerD